MRSGPALALALLLVSAGCLGVPLDRFVGAQHDPDAVLSACPDHLPSEDRRGSRPDPAEDVRGWENGVWHDDPIDADQGDGLDCEELALVLARTMARVEEIRDLEFVVTPNLRVIDRETFRERSRSESTPAAERARQNVLYEALFMVGEGSDATAVQGENRGTSVAAYYQPATDSIVVITPSPDRVQIRSGLLAHELVHALQDQHFERTAPANPTLDAAKARLGLTEGDANYVEYRYERECEGAWAGTCFVPDPRPGSGSGGLANVGMYLVTYQPYSDGPAFVDALRADGGWESVNDAYRRVPESTEQTIHPEKYPTDEPTDATVADRSTDRWELVTTDGEPDYETVGEAGLFAMFAFPYYDSDGRVELVPADSFRNRDESGSLDPFDPYDYRANYSEGWDGDRLLAYRNGGGESAYVWRLVFDSPDDAREFRDGYRALLAYRGAEPTDDRDGTWTIPEGEPFADAFSVDRTGNRVTIVNAPTVDDLAEVRSNG